MREARVPAPGSKRRTKFGVTFTWRVLVCACRPLCLVRVSDLWHEPRAHRNVGNPGAP